MKRWRFAFAAACALVGGVAIACGPGFLDGISGGTKLEPDAEASAPAVDARACNLRHLPERPPGADDQNANVTLPTFTFESLRVDTLGTSDAGGAIPIGLDLDDRCTCPETDSCKRVVGDGGKICDGTRGEDNALSAFFNEINLRVPLFPQTFATDRIRDGFFTFFIDILGWNGLPDDPRVTVTLRLSPQLDGADAGARPKQDGTDVWKVDPATIAGGEESIGKDCRVPADSFRCLARVRDDDAYVRDGRLVAHPRLDQQPGAPVSVLVRAGLGNIDFNVFDLTMSAALSAPAGGLPTRLEGELTGRVSTTNVLRTIGQLQDFTGTSGSPICKNAPVFVLAKTYVCTAPDVATVGKDNTGANCEFLSTALSFSAGPGIAGTIFKPEDVLPTCDESTFTCP